MKGDKKVIDALNEVLTAELTAINIYYLHYKMQEDWGYEKLAAHAKEESMGVLGFTMRTEKPFSHYA